MNYCFFESHCHFDFAQFDADRYELWRACQALGVQQLLIPGVAPQYWVRQRQICTSYKGIYYALGIHPWWIAELTQDDDIELEQALAIHARALRELLEEDRSVAAIPPVAGQTPMRRCLAIGETGLDKMIATPMDTQRRLLHWHIDLANEFKLPLIVHSIKAHADVIQLCKDNPPRFGGVIHGFSGSYELALQFVALGFHLGVGGTISYVRAQKTRAALQKIPLEYLLLETDAPDMPLSGRQGERNSPLYIPEVAQQLALLRAEPLAHIAAQTHENSLKLFGLGS